MKNLLRASLTNIVDYFRVFFSIIKTKIFLLGNFYLLDSVSGIVFYLINLQSWKSREKHRLIFLHIPKNGGTYFLAASRLKGFHVESQGHHSLGFYNPVIRQADHTTIICTIRLPIDRFLSAINYLLYSDKISRNDRLDRLILRNIIRNTKTNVDCSVLSLKTTKAILNAASLIAHLAPQVLWIGKYKFENVSNFAEKPNKFTLVCIPVDSIDELFPRQSMISIVGEQNSSPKRYTQLAPEAQELVNHYYRKDLIFYRYALQCAPESVNTINQLLNDS